MVQMRLLRIIFGGIEGRDIESTYIRKYGFTPGIGTISVTLSLMHARKWIRKESSKKYADKRAREYYLTPEGIRVYLDAQWKYIQASGAYHKINKPKQKPRNWFVHQ
jgi:DNA-binding PadR family transcriptional regulator